MEKKHVWKKTRPSLLSCVQCESSEEEEVPPFGITHRVDQVTTVSFKVNGKVISVEVAKILPSLSLAKFLRDEIHLTGTKICCAQGGCGACIVTARIPTGLQGQLNVMSVNSCLVPVIGCDGWDITTVEGLGSRRTKLHPIQKRLAAFHGSQCGFCTPGMIMQLNSLLSGKSQVTIGEVEHVIDGNLCRCTGYRPILDAFKTFAVDVPENLKAKVSDIEDLNEENLCQNGNKCLKGICNKKKTSLRHILSDGSEWYAPVTIADLLNTLNSIPADKTYRIVGGNTGRGVFDSYTTYDVYISIRQIAELSSFEMSSNQFQVGSAVTLNAFIDILESIAKTAPQNFIFSEGMARHIRKVANTGIRNSGTLGGNLMLKHAHNQFPSDIFILLESVGAKLIIKSSNNETKCGVQEFLSLDMTKKIIYKIELPASSSLHKFASFKITPRSENAHAYVNAACYAQVDGNFVVQGTPSLVFGGVSSSFVHATKTEAFLVGKKLNDTGVLLSACKVLNDETKPTSDPVLASIQYRKYLPQALLYKFVLSVLGKQADPRLQSGSIQIQRGLSSGQQHYETDPSLYPVNKPIPKIEGESQCTGEAEYVDDIPTLPNELYAAFVLSTVGNCEIDAVDPSEALAIPGVVAFYDHTSIPGKNSCVTYNIEEPIFSEGRIEYAGQAIGVVVADTLSLAIKGAHTVKVSYKNRQKPILTIKEALLQPERIKDSKRPQPFSDPIPSESNLVQVSGEFEIGSQYHFHMETQSVIVKPKEDLQLEILAACQWMDNIQVVVSQALKIPEGSIEVKVRRMGGAYGGKARPTAHVAAAAAVAAVHLNRPVRLIMDLKSNMELMGKRFPYLTKYQAGATPEGRLIFVSALIYCDCGFTYNEATSSVAAAFAKNCYKAVAWNIRSKDVLTNTPSNTYCRAPGTTQGVAIIEYIMDHLASSLGMDPLEFRLKNLVGTSSDIPNPLPEIIPALKLSSDYDRRLKDVQDFNQNNLWKKRAIAFIPLCYPFSCSGTTFYFQISIFAFDGTVVISHGGTEMGQGINTKVVQTVAQQLGLPVGQISLRPAQTFISPNTSATWGSTGTDTTCTAAIKACKDLKERMGKVAENMNNPSWFELVQECYNQGVDLSARYMGFTDRDGPADYLIWSAVVTEVEVDALTGEKNVRRVDMIEDIGTSINPEIDIGQLEGAFVMSLGLWMTEEIKYDPETGRLVTADTWEYKPPASHDIPEDLRTTFYNGKKGPSGVLGSKATGEPSVLMGVSALLAIHRALAEARKDLGIDPKEWFQLSGPATCERMQLSAGITSEHFRL